MTCQTMMSLGVYVLGAADAEESRQVRAHLPGCPACRAELALLRPLPGLLARVPEDALAAEPPLGRAARQRPGRGARQRPGRGARQRPGRVLTSAQTVPPRSYRAGPPSGPRRSGRAGARPGPGGPRPWPQRWPPSRVRPADSGLRPGLRATGRPRSRSPARTRPCTCARPRLSPRHPGARASSFGFDGLPLNVPCRLIVRSRAGATEITGVWDAWRTGPVTVPASAGWLPSDIASLQVATTTRNLVTISGRPANVAG